jgi:hypothetical protein
MIDPVILPEKEPPDSGDNRTQGTANYDQLEPAGNGRIPHFKLTLFNGQHIV